MQATFSFYSQSPRPAINFAEHVTVLATHDPANCGDWWHHHYTVDVEPKTRYELSDIVTGSSGVMAGTYLSKSTTKNRGVAPPFWANPNWIHKHR